jgi:hypothetical protein
LPLGNVEDDGVTGGECSNGAAMSSFRSDVSGHQAVRGAGESAVGKKRDGIA